MVLRELWLLVRDAALLLRHLPDEITRWADRQVMAAHKPEMVPPDDQWWPNGEMPWCLRCGTVWPCEPAAEVAERMTGRGSA